MKYKNTKYMEKELDEAFGFTNNLVKELQIKLWKKMAKEDKVYSVVHCRWEKREFVEKLGGKIIDPGKELKKYDVKTKEMRV